MQIFKKYALLAASFLLLAGSSVAYADSHTELWEIESFHTEMTMDQYGRLNITETILADFAKEEHRGMARNIPYKRDDRNTQIKFISAKDEHGQDWALEKYNSNGDLVLEMRKPDNEPDNEKHTFVIKYEQNNIINRFDEHDELYMNVNGLSWPVKAKNISAQISLPHAFEKSEIETICFTGKYESSQQNCAISHINPNTITVKSNSELQAYENLTFAIKFPPQTFPLPPVTKSEKTAQMFIKILSFHGVFVFLIMFTLWYKTGRDEKTEKTTVIPHYKPPRGLSPTEMGTIIDEKIDQRDITATIIDFAVRGYIKIKELEGEKVLFFKGKKDYELELVKPYETTKEHEKITLENIFPINEVGVKTKVSSLQNKFYKHIKKIETSVMDQLVKADYFPHNPKKITSIYKIVGLILLGIGIQLNVLLVQYLGIIFTINFIISALLVLGFGFIMPRKTKKGAETYYELKGLYEYINTAEKDRMKFQEEHLILFEKLLPYAMAFGLITKWSKAFSGIVAVPSWFVATSSDFTLTDFGSHLDTFRSDFSDSIHSSPNNSGSGWSGGSGFSGGFSGGGFGGGGGGGL